MYNLEASTSHKHETPKEQKATISCQREINKGRMRGRPRSLSGCGKDTAREQGERNGTCVTHASELE
jgi:hypothetical protein